MSAGILLDTNVLIALAWPKQQAHGKVREWFRKNASQGWATCPVTQGGFIRISSNPAFSPDAVTPNEAASLLRLNLNHPGHRFWGDDIDLAQVFEVFGSRIVGHRQITDAYLLGLAMHKKSKLATLDQGLGDLLPDPTSQREFLVFV